MTSERSDRGATVPAVVIMLTALMAMAAFAVDLGAVFVQRRHNQSAADTGALGGALDIPTGMTTASEATAGVIRSNLGITYTDAEWTALWTNCTDSGSLTFTGEVLGTSTECISFDGLGTYRVTLPDQEVDAAFANVVGYRSFTTGATAEVTLSINGVGGVLPFAVLGSAGSGTQICMRSSAGGTATPPCTGTESGNFGALEVAQWGNPLYGTESLSCNLNKTAQLLVNLSVGIDHYIRPYTGTEIVDTCSKPFGPNTLSTFQGISGGLFEGMITGDVVQSVPFAGRLTLGSTARLTVTHGGSAYELDNAPLWEYIGYGKTGFVPATCTRESFDNTVIISGHAAAETQLETCLADYAAGSGYATLFDYDADNDYVPDIAGSPRYGVVPQFIETSFPGGASADLHIGGFRGVFIQGLYFGCNGVTCGTTITPGALTGPISLPNGGSPLDQISAFLLPEDTVPSSLIDNGVNGDLGPFTVRLSR